MDGADLQGILSAIKGNIDLVEKGDVSSDVLDDIKRNFIDLVELCKLFLLSERDTYYGHFLMNMQARADFHSDTIAGILLGEYPPVLVANPLLLGKLTLKEVLYVICHEIDHVLYNHPAEMMRANPAGDPEVFKRFNYAADAAVNDRLDFEISEGASYLSAPAGIVNSKTLSKMFSLGRILPLESYRYYFNLIKDRAIQEDAVPAPRLVMDAQGAKNDGKGVRNAEDEVQDGVVTASEMTGESDHAWGDGLDADELEAAANELVSEVVENMSEETRGQMPARFTAQVNRVNAPAKISWQSMLKRYIGTISAGKRKTRARLNRRQPSRFDLSGSMDDKVLKIVVAIDTSGSVSDKEVAEFFNEIFAIIAHRKHEVTVIECDSAVQRVYRVSSPADVQMKVAGRGGTSFSPVIKYVNSDRYFRDALLVYFTDGYGERDIPRPRTYRNLWVVLGNEKNLSLRDPYGVVIAL